MDKKYSNGPKRLYNFTEKYPCVQKLISIIKEAKFTKNVLSRKKTISEPSKWKAKFVNLEKEICEHIKDCCNQVQRCFVVKFFANSDELIQNFTSKFKKVIAEYPNLMIFDCSSCKEYSNLCEFGTQKLQSQGHQSQDKLLYNLITLVYSDIRVTLKLYSNIIQNEELIEHICDITFRNPVPLLMSNYDILDQWNLLAHDIFEDKICIQNNDYDII